MSALHRAASVTLWALVIALIGALVGVGATAGQEPNRAALIVEFASGQPEGSCVEFSEEEISGADLLRRSGLAVVFSGFGGLGQGVCQIDGTGCSDPGDCFCQCTGADCQYWSYWVFEDGAWRFQAVGASQRDVRDGELHAWVWGDGDTPPQGASFRQVCPLVAAPTARPPRADEPPPRPRQQDEPRDDPAPAAGPNPAAAPDVNDGVMQATEPLETVEQQATAQARRPAATARPPAGGEAIDEDEGGGGTPVGLIAFGGVAGALVAGAAGIALRRRLGG